MRYSYYKIAALFSFNTGCFSILTENTSSWLRVIESCGEEQRGWSMVETSDHDILVAGIDSYSSDGPLVASYDQAGNLVNFVKLGGVNYRYYSSTDLISLSQNYDDTYLTLAYYTPLYPTGLVVTKWSNVGEMEWSVIGNDPSCSLSPYSMTSLPDGRFMITGKSGCDTIFLAQYTQAAQMLWRTDLDLSEAHGCSVRGMTLSKDSDAILIAGSVDFGDDAEDDILLAQYDLNGVRQWLITIGGTTDDSAYDIVLANDGNYLVTGYTSWTYYHDIFLIKVNQSGALLSASTLYGSGEDVGYALAQLVDGRVVIVGGTDTCGAGYDNIFVGLYNASGHFYSAQVLSSDSSAYDVIATQDGGFALTGYLRQDDDDEIITIKFNSSGELSNKTLPTGVSLVDCSNLFFSVPNKPMVKYPNISDINQLSLWLNKTDNLYADQLDITCNSSNNSNNAVTVIIVFSVLFALGLIGYFGRNPKRSSQAEPNKSSTQLIDAAVPPSNLTQLGHFANQAAHPVELGAEGHGFGVNQKGFVS